MTVHTVHTVRRALAARAYWGLGGPALRRLPAGLGERLPPLAARLARPAAGVRSAMASALPEAPPEALDRWALEEARLRLRTRLERLRYPAWTAAAARARVEVVGAELLEEALSSGRGAVLVAAHFGVHAMPPLALGLLGWPVNVVRVMRPDGELGAARGWSQSRRRAMEDALPVRYLDAGHSGAAAALRRGELLTIGGDGESVGLITGAPDRTAPLLGRPTAWPTAAFSLAEAAGAPLLWLLPLSRDDRHLLTIGRLARSDPQRDYIDRYQGWLRDHPGQWQFWRDR